MPNLEDNAASYALAFEEGKRAVDAQLASLESVRVRIGTLFSAAGLTAALLTGLAFGDGRADDMTALAAVGFAIASVFFMIICGALIYIWTPVKGKYSLDPETIIFSYIEAQPPASLAFGVEVLALGLAVWDVMT